MGKKVVVLGGSGVGMIAASIIEHHYPDHKLIGFLNDVIPVGQQIGKFKSYPVIGKSTDVLKYVEDPDTYAFIGYIGMTKESEIYEKISSLEIPQEKFISILDPSAIIPNGYCSLGNGILVAPLAQLSPDTTIGDNCILLPNSFVGHDSTLENFVSIATNSVIGANVHIGRGSHIGSNATIREKVKIGEFSLVGMGAVVLKDVPPNSIVVGNPEKVLKVK